MNQRTLAIIAITLGVLLVISLGFLALFGVRLSDANAVKTSEIASNLATQEKKLKTDFQASLETTLSTYTSDVVFGSFSFSYPKVWSTNVKQTNNAREALVFLADPDLIVVNTNVAGPYTALRVEVYTESYDGMVKDTRSKYISNEKTSYKESDVVVSGVSGKKYTGTNSDSKKNVAFTLLPLRDKTLYIGTDDSDKFAKNLDTIVKSFKINK